MSAIEWLDGVRADLDAYEIGHADASHAQNVGVYLFETKLP